MGLPFKEVAGSYKRIESLSGRLEMTDELIDLLSGRSPEEMEILVRLTKGEVRPGYEGVELGVAEKLVVKALYQVTMIPIEEIEERRKTIGDIGLLAEEVMERKMQMSLFQEPLTIERVFQNLERIARTEGKASQDVKLKIVAEMLHDATPGEARYITRIVCQKMRLGIADMTVIDALAYIHTDGFEGTLDAILAEPGLVYIHPMAERLRGRKTSDLYSLIDVLSRPKKNDLPAGESKKALSMLEDLKAKVQEVREEIVRTFNVHPDLGYVARELVMSGSGMIGSIGVEPGVPLRAMLGERLSSIGSILDKMKGKAALEYKYDGLRVQVHLFDRSSSKRTRLFSRQLEDITDQFPDVVGYLERAFKGMSAIVEGECVPVDPGNGALLPFQTISRRRGRKHDVENKIEEVPVSMILFDCLYLDGEDRTGVPYLERRELLKNSFKGLTEDIDLERGVSLSRMEVIDDPEKGEIFFNNALEGGCEGIMAKSISPNSVYQAGSRGWLWIKYKRDYRSEISDTLDLVVVGAFHGAGRRKGTYGALLMAALDSTGSTFHTVCKLGSGFTDEDLSLLKPMVDSLKGPKDQVWVEVDSKMEPDVFVRPGIVLEVLGAEITFSPMHTCSFGKLKEGFGLALRFPRFTGRYREDKGPMDATTQNEVESLYTIQNKVLL